MAPLEVESTKIEDMVSARSLGSIANVEDAFKSGKQKMTFYVIFACITGAIAGLLFGFDQNIFNMILAQEDFRTYFKLPLLEGGCGPDAPKDPTWVANKLSMINGFYPLGCALTAPFAGAISDRIGRYKTLWIGMLVFFLGASIQTGANSHGMLVAGRLIAGGSVGVLSAVAPVFISELSPAHLRGSLGTLFQLGLTFGALFSSIWCMIIQKTVGDAPGYGWRIEAGMQLVIGLLMALSLVFCPESPRWLAKAGYTDKAKATLKKLRGKESKEVTEAELAEILAEVEAEKETPAGIKDLFTKRVRLATMVALSIPILQQLTGINVFMTYSATIYNNLCLDGSMLTLMQNVVNFLATFTSLYLSDGVGRKKILMIASSLICLFLVIASIVLWTVNLELHPAAGYGYYVLVLLYTICFAMAWGPNGWIIPTEVYPLRLRGKGAGLATCNNWWFSFIVIYTSPLGINSPLGAAGLMVIYAICMFVTVPLLHYLMPETKNVPLEEMEAKFDKPFKQYVEDNKSDLRQRKKEEDNYPSDQSKV